MESNSEIFEQVQKEMVDEGVDGKRNSAGSKEEESNAVELKEKLTDVIWTPSEGTCQRGRVRFHEQASGSRRRSKLAKSLARHSSAGS